MFFLSGLRQFLLAGFCALAALPAVAQNGPFDPVARVGDRVVTAFELDQRTRFFELLNASADTRKRALEQLVDERLQAAATELYGIRPTEDQIIAGQEEFSQRGQLSREDFLTLLAGNGIEEQTFRDFVTTGMAWRELIRGRYAPRVQITERDIDQALSATAPRPNGVRVLYSELIMRADTPAYRAEAMARAEQLWANPSVNGFSAAAREFGVTPSKDQGGRLDWVNLADMQPGLATILLTLQPGEVSKPVSLPNAVAVFQMRAIEETDAPEPEGIEHDYMIYYLPGGHSPETLARAAQISQDTDRCEDIYPLNNGQPDELLVRLVQPRDQVPSDVAYEIAKLDAGEISTGLTETANGQFRLLMLCDRRLALPEGVSRDQVREQLFSQRLGSYAEGFLAELRANTNITILVP